MFNLIYHNPIYIYLDQYNELCYGGIALPSDLNIIFSNIEKESESVPTPDCGDSSSCFKNLSIGTHTHTYI